MKLPEHPKDGDTIEIYGHKFTWTPSRKVNSSEILIGATHCNTIARVEALWKSLNGIKLSKKEKELLGI